MTARKQFSIVLVVIALVIVGVITARHFLSDELSPLGVGAKAPDFQAMTIATPLTEKTLADYSGKVTLLNVWATWCVPCRMEMPSIEKLQQEYGPKGLNIVAISIDDAGSDAGIRAFAKQFGLTFEILHDPSGGIEREYQTTGVPETVLIGRDGIIRNKVAGATDWNSASNRRLVERLLAE